MTKLFERNLLNSKTLLALLVLFVTFFVSFLNSSLPNPSVAKLKVEPTHPIHLASNASVCDFSLSELFQHRVVKKQFYFKEIVNSIIEFTQSVSHLVVTQATDAVMYIGQKLQFLSQLPELLLQMSNLVFRFLQTNLS